MRKILTISSICILMATTFIGCGNTLNDTNTQVNDESPVFTMIEIPVQTSWYAAEACHFYKDPVTDIVYMQFNGAYSKGGLTYLPDPDTGLPLKYERFLELYKDYIY